MKIAYVISTNTDQLNGIGNKVVNQVSSWCDLGENARVLAFSPIIGDAMSSIPGWVLDMRNPFGSGLLGKVKRVYQYLKAVLLLFLWRPDVIYVRAAEKPHGSQFWGILGAKVICEINADLERQIEVDISTEVIDTKEGLRRLSLWKQALKTCEGVVSVSHQMDEVNQKFYEGRPHTVVWNSIKFDGSDGIERTNRDNVRPKLCFIGAENFSWNGIDLLMEFSKRTVGELDFVVIGAANNGSFPENVKEYPYMENSEMLKVLAGCDIGMGTMALFRKGLNECSALKVRDYAALGVPMLLAYKETPFVGKDLPDWVLEIENEEGTMNLNEKKIIAFAEKWKGKSFDPSLAKPFFDSLIVEKHRLDFFENVFHAG